MVTKLIYPSIWWEKNVTELPVTAAIRWNNFTFFKWLYVWSHKGVTISLYSVFPTCSMKFQAYRCGLTNTFTIIDY